MLLLALRFVLELGGIAALGCIGATVPANMALRVALGIGLPAALVAVWGLVVAPKADNPLPQRARQLIGSALLVGVGASLALAGHREWGIALAATVLIDQALLLRLGLGDPSAALGSLASQGGR